MEKATVQLYPLRLGFLIGYLVSERALLREHMDAQAPDDRTVWEYDMFGNIIDDLVSSSGYPWVVDAEEKTSKDT